MHSTVASLSIVIFLGVEMRSLQRIARENAHRIFEENEKLKHDLDNKKKEIESRTRELDRLEAASEGDKRRLHDEKQKV
jgi:Skp family chaperone for outer membrane proteins